MNKEDVKMCNCAGTPEYFCWKAMIDRCTNQNNRRWRRYGGRGIKVCQRWIDSLLDFIADVGRRPSKHYSIDRIDNDGDYEPGNVRWATRRQQQQNMVNNLKITYKGETLCLTEWARRTGIKFTTIRRRIDSGWPIEHVFEKRLQLRPVTYQGITLSLGAWAKKLGIGYTTLRNRLDRGWSVEEALSVPKGVYS